jgi:hypothetical protein
MMLSRVLLISLALAAGFAPTASAASKPLTTLKVRSCEVGETAKARMATFYARMRAVKGTRQMAMRFTLIDRAGDGPPEAVEHPALAQWRRSRPGVKEFGYAQSVAGLEKGGVYSVQVQFRWTDGRGKVLRTSKRTSSACRQQGELPNLAITRVAARAGDSPGTELYSVDLTNSGQGEARDVSVDLFIDGAAADSQTIALVKPGETLTVRFTGPGCERALRMVADRLDTLNETNEDDNVLRSRCPAVGG